MVNYNVSIETVEDHPAQNGKKAYTRVKTSQGWMSCFNTPLATELRQHQGQAPVTLDVTVNGQFMNINGIVQNAIPPVAPVQPAQATQVYANGTTTPSTGSNEGDRQAVSKAVVLPGTQVLIVRQCCLKAAVDLYIGVDERGPRDDIMTMAAEMETWVFR